jgi:hypothetical protein
MALFLAGQAAVVMRDDILCDEVGGLMSMRGDSIVTVMVVA